MTFDTLRDIDQRVEFVVAEASGVLLLDRNLFVDHAGTSGVRPVLAQLASKRCG